MKTSGCNYGSNPTTASSIVGLDFLLSILINAVAEGML